MARCDFARWAPDNATPGGPIVPRVVILHCTATSSDAHPHHGLEWHFEIAKDGSIDQLVDTELQADANCHANSFAISVETVGLGPEALTDAQLQSFIRLCRWANATHNVPLSRCDRWNGSGIGYHTMWGAPSHWTPVAKSCPGQKRIEQFDTIILPELAIPQPVPVPPGLEDDPMLTFLLDSYELYLGLTRSQVMNDKALRIDVDYHHWRLLNNGAGQAGPTPTLEGYRSWFADAARKAGRI